MLNIKQNHPLAQLTTFQIGGPAEYFGEVRSKEDIVEAFSLAKEKGIGITILGGGSNVLISDQGVKGLVIVLKNDDVAIRGERIIASGGAPLAKILSLASGEGLSGLEWAHGIPRATLGGSIRGNAGAFGALIAAIVETVEVYDQGKNIFETLSNRMCAFAYRTSLFKENPNLLIWSATLKMRRTEKNEILQRMEKSLKFRLDKYPRLPSAGSVFENLDAEDVFESNPELYEELKGRINDQKQIGAGLIIDMLGLKGKSIGGAKISLEHANHIVNTGKASADEVAQLIAFIKTRVRNEFGLNLREEVRYLGF